LSLREVGTRNAHLSPGNPDVKEAVTKMEEETTAAGVNTTRKDVENRMAEEIGIISPLTVLRHHHLEKEVETEAEDHTPIQNPLSAGGIHETHGNVNEYKVGYIGRKSFGKRIHEEEAPKGLNLKSPGNLKNYNAKRGQTPGLKTTSMLPTLLEVGTKNRACRMIQLYLVGPARVWLSDLQRNSIFCWFDLKIAFESHFKGTYKRASTANDL
jgi:hypothetical protein